jgi:GMP synthase PP-ATPase subunit
MSVADQAMYDKIIIAQIKGRVAKMAEFDALEEKSKTREGYNSMSVEDKKKFKNAWNMQYDNDDRRKF